MEEKIYVCDDFDDLGKPIAFKYGGKQYEIPAIVPKKSKTLMRMGRDIARKSKANEAKMKELEESNQDIPDEVLNELDAIFDFQVDFIVAAGAQEVEDDQRKAVEKTFIEEHWSNKLVGRLFKLINDNMVDKVDTEQEKKS